MCRHVGRIKNHVAHKPCDQATRTIARMQHLCAVSFCVIVPWVHRYKCFFFEDIKYYRKSKNIKKIPNSVKNYKPGTTVQKKQTPISNPGTTVPNAQKTNYTKKHTGGLSENCSRLQSLCSHHFGDWQGYSAALGDAPSQLKTSRRIWLAAGTVHPSNAPSLSVLRHSFV